jgi:hypothetical protein
MSSAGWMEQAIEAVADEWQRGRAWDPRLAPQEPPDLAHLTGYSLDDVRYNCVGLLSPDQRWDAKKAMLRNFAGLVFATGFMALMLANGGGLVSGLMLIIVVTFGLKSIFDAFVERKDPVMQVDGDLWTELERDSDGPDRHFVRIAGHKLEITRKADALLTAGGPYRIYYLPSSRRAVGGLVLPGWRPVPLPEPAKKPWWSRFNLEVGG